ncbi:hypothetical protein [Xanthomonas maliensis]|uniref:hypothetical protein n=1 Tax=Xanthomonas maliensis TaxID=1321368 RepID=UPI0003A42034|nr:hypothetical protein [Xanthomonas maliensis]KAB7769333.1 hypothetical protein CKY51_07030 [Xanthomonas maliensis]
MSKRQVWELLKQGCNAAEIAAAANVSDAVASSMIDEALGRVRGESLREQDRQMADHRVGNALGGLVVSL